MPANLVVVDGWSGAVRVAKHIPGLHPLAHPETEGLLLSCTDGRLLTLGYQDFSLGEAGGLELEPDENISSFQDCWITWTSNKQVRLHEPRGSLLATLPLETRSIQPWMEWHEGGLARSVLHLDIEEQVHSYVFDTIPWHTRLLGNRWLKWSWIAAFLVLLTVVSRRISFQERMLRSIVADGVEAVAIVDARGRVLFANEGFRREEPLDVPALIHDLTHEEMDSEPRPRAGRWMHWSLRPLRIRYRRLGWVLIGVDETDRMTGRELKRIVDFTGMLTHNLQNPLVPIELAEHELREGLLERAGQGHEFQEPLDMIRDSVQVIRSRIDRFLKLVEVDEERVIASVRNLLEQSLEESGFRSMSGIRIEWCLPESDIQVLGAAGSLRALLSTLMTNAMEAMERKGCIRVEAREDRIARIVELRICDTGPGIAPEVLARIWDAGFSTKPRGSGYGLFLARNIALAHGGTLDITSKPGEGACARLRLPGLQEGDQIERTDT